MKRKWLKGLLLGIFVVTLSACNSKISEYDDVIDSVYKEIQEKSDDKVEYGDRDESNTTLYTVNGHEDDAIMIQVYYPSESPSTGKVNYETDWYVMKRKQMT
ncbi:hypothetical protein GCM10025886_14230 [Tetragenococcus halophilus subsp. flandriensis]|uniref:hypothetical protein n=1 Tax=Tetragenococcus halophilus TaxID=51669 RepID=UPI0023E9E7B6|nr:hypothetical protein [Tetragenococcus halophilus]GMA08272.1 hypothetical protein GCM10025886_14230 [Tetragenococcus halophilus subsp. flandriensis]